MVEARAYLILTRDELCRALLMDEPDADSAAAAFKQVCQAIDIIYSILAEDE